ncbi:Glutathione peroxidase 7 [Bulinus truncatus]|nr:Glutathione peroxidase 7 [Bulinus truncatus]
MALVLISLFSSVHGNNGENVDFYSFDALDINNKKVSLEKFRGKVSLVVNVASECGYTDGHYQGLNFLQDSLADSKLFNVLAFPCNQFGQQEPGSAEEIYDFVHINKRAKFSLFAKVNVVHQNVHPAWNFLISTTGQAPTWNFWKYLVDHNGHVISAWGPHTDPEDLLDTVKEAVNNISSASRTRGDEF